MTLFGCEVEDIVIAGINEKDYPNFSDAYIFWAEWTSTGASLSTSECDALTEKMRKSGEFTELIVKRLKA